MNKSFINNPVKRILHIFILVLLLVLSMKYSSAYKENGHIGLLTVSESENGSIQRGGIADLYLNIRPGSGRIYIDSFPLSRLDTQITMRFASELACDFLQIDCSNLDFFYTIRADSSMVGGPSAGAAATVLAIAMLDNQEIDQKTIMTGTINSGFLIGPVAGISEKTLAAEKHGYKKALIPKWDVTNDDLNKTGIQIIRVSRIEEALYEFTGKNYSKNYPEITPSDEYLKIMKLIAIDICSKYGSFNNSVIFMPNTSKNETKDYFGLAIDAVNSGRYYSAASYCFGGNVKILTEMYENVSKRKLKQEYAKLLGEISVKEYSIDEREIKTIADLETYMIVKERIEDAKRILREENPENVSAKSIAYVKERLDTADFWSKFFYLKGKNFEENPIVLENACNKKISEAEERISYLKIYYPREIDRTELRKAYNYYDSKDYALCIFSASKAKADVDVVLGVLFLDEENIDSLLEEKLAAASLVINRQKEFGLFPILGYSYYEYAHSLRKEEPYSALLYAEYALEMSNLNMYIGVQKAKTEKVFFIDRMYVLLFFLGFIFGLFVFFLYMKIFYKHNKNNNLKMVKKLNNKAPVSIVSLKTSSKNISKKRSNKRLKDSNN